MTGKPETPDLTITRPYRRSQDHQTGRTDAVELHSSSVSGTLTASMKMQQVKRVMLLLF